MTDSSPRNPAPDAVKNVGTIAEGSPAHHGGGGAGFTKGGMELPNNASSDGRPPYIPQFSTATSLILDRIKFGSNGLDSALSNVPTSIILPDKAAYEDAKSRVVQSMKTTLSTLTPDTSATQHTLPLNSGSGRETEHVFSASVKRKRDLQTEKVDFTQNTISFPWTEKRSSPVKLEDQSKTTAEEEARKQDEISRLRRRSNPLRQDDIEKLREEHLALLPTGVVPARPELVGFGAGRASDFAVRNMKSEEVKSC